MGRRVKRRACRGRLELPVAGRTLHLFVLSDTVVRVAYSEPGTTLQADRGWTTDGVRWPEAPLQVERESTAIVVETASLEIRVDPLYGDVEILDRAGRPVSSDVRGQSDGRYVRSVRKKLVDGERLYGLGEKTGPLDHRGRRLQMWNTDPLFPDPNGYTPASDPIYQSHPWLIGLRDGLAYGIYLNATHRTHFDLGATAVDELELSTDAGDLDYVLFYGPLLPQVVERYTALVGRSALPPLWALGYHQCRWSYVPERRVREVADGLRQRKIAADGIWLDIDYMDGFRCFTWDRETFPDPPRLVRDLAGQGFTTTAIIDPGIKCDPDYAVYREGLAGGHFVCNPDGTPYEGQVWPGATHFADFTRPATRAWWSDRVERFAREYGLGGIWIDMNEPVTWHRDGFALDTRFDGEGRQTDHREARNVYALLMAQATAEGLGRVVDRPFVLTRAGFSGIQRYAAVWTGDMSSSWEHLQMAPAMLMNMGLSGMTLCGTDVGGFSGGPTAELFVRWLQVGTFSPFFRTHVCRGAPAQEPWSFGTDAEAIAREQIALRYRLLPYLYSLAWQATQTGAPVLRPLVYEFQADEQTHDICDQFMVGPFLLVAPVLRDQQREREVYLPPGQWYEGLDANRLHQGGRVVRVSAPLSRLPLFVRAGAILPTAVPAQHVGQMDLDQIALWLFPARGSAQRSALTLYADDGRSAAYREGAYAIYEIELTGDSDHPRLTTRRSGGDGRVDVRFSWRTIV